VTEAKRFDLRDPAAAGAARARICSIVQRYRGDGRVLDAGGGDGATLPGESTIVLDMDPGLLRAATEDGALAVAGDLQCMPIRTASLGQVLMCHSLEHCQDTLAALAEVGRILKPGGHAVIIVPNAASLRQLQTLVAGDVRPAGNRPDGDTQHQHHYTLKLLRALLRGQDWAELIETRGDVVSFPLTRTLHLRWLGRGLAWLFPKWSDAIIAVCRRR